MDKTLLVIGSLFKVYSHACTLLHVAAKSLRQGVFVLALFTAHFSLSQNFPVTVTTQVTPPYSLFLSDYTEPGSTRLITTLLLNEIGRFQYQAKLRIRIEGNNIEIRTNPNFVPRPIILDGGVPLQLFGSDIAEYFDPRNLVFSGITQQEFERTGALPEGFYRLTIEVFDFNRTVQVSRAAPAILPLFLNDPPLLNLPFNGEKLRAALPQNIVFQWTPRHTGSPNSAFSVEYQFTLVEINPKGRNPFDAMLSSTPIFTTTTSSTVLVYSAAEPTLVPGNEYAFQVRAVDTGNRDLFRNQGLSEVYMFTFGDACLSPENIRGEGVDAARVRIHWEGQFNHQGYRIRLRERNNPNANWFEEESLLNDAVIASLKPQTEYEFQVSGNCASGVFSEYSSKGYVSTSELVQQEFACGLPIEEVDLSGQELLPMLNVGDRVNAGDFNVEIVEASGANGRFSGKANLVIPFMNYVKVGAEFSGVTINTDYQLVNGSMRVVGATYQVAPDEVLDAVDEFDDGLNQLDDILNEADSIVDAAEETVEDVEEVLDSLGIGENDSEGDVALGGTGTEGTSGGLPDGSDEDSDTDNSDSTGVGQSENGADVQTGGGTSGGGGATPIGDVAAAENEPQNESSGIDPQNLEDGQLNLGPLIVYFSEVPQPISTDSSGYCSYEDVLVEVDLGYNDPLVASAEFTIEGVSISFKQHCENKDFKEISLSYSDDTGISIGNLVFMETILKGLNLSVDNSGKLNGSLQLSAGLSEDYTYQNLLKIRKGVSGHFSFSFANENSFSGIFDFSGIQNLNLSLLKGETEIAALENGNFNNERKFLGTMKLLPGVVSFSNGYFRTTLTQLEINTSFSFKDGLSLLSGTSSLRLDEFNELQGSIQLSQSYQDNEIASTIESNTTLSGFGMEFSNLNLHARLDRDFDLKSIAGSLSAKHTEFDAAIGVTDFLYDSLGLQRFEANGQVGYQSIDLIIENSSYSSRDSLISIDASALVQVDGVDAAVRVSETTIDLAGNIILGEYDAEVKSDVVMGPILVKFEGKVTDKNRKDENGRKYKEFSTKGEVKLKTISSRGVERYKTISQVDVTYEEYKPDGKDDLSTPAERFKKGNLSWSGNADFPKIYDIESAITRIEVAVDSEGNIEGNLGFEANLKEDIQVVSLITLKKGLNGEINYEFSGERSFEGRFDLTNLKNINLEMTKGKTVIASLEDGSFNSSQVLNGTFSALENAQFESNNFDVTVNQLQLNASYGLKSEELVFNSGSGELTVDKITGVEGKISLNLDYGIDGNFNAQINAQESTISALGLSFDDLALQASITSDFDLTSISGSTTASHADFDGELIISEFEVYKGSLKTLKADGNVLYQGFNFELNDASYTNNTLELSAKLAINATGTEAKFAVDRFRLAQNGEVSIGSVEGDLKKGNHLLVGFRAGFEDSRFTGSFDGELKTIGVGISGDVDIGKQEDFNFAHLKLKGQTNLILGSTGLKITQLAGEVGYNYSLAYDAQRNVFTGNPEKGNYLLGLTLGMADVAEMCEIVGNPIAQFGNNSFQLSLNGSLNITKDNPYLSSDLTANYRLPENTMEGSVITNIAIPQSTGKIFNANAAVNFGFGDNNWYSNASQINGSVLEVINFTGNFDFSGRISPFSVTNLSLNGYAGYNYAIDYSFDFSSTVGFQLQAGAGFNSSVELAINDSGINGEAQVDINGNLLVKATALGITYEPFNSSFKAEAKLGYQNNQGYINAVYERQISFFGFDEQVPLQLNYEF